MLPSGKMFTKKDDDDDDETDLEVLVLFMASMLSEVGFVFPTVVNVDGSLVEVTDVFVEAANVDDEARDVDVVDDPDADAAAEAPNCHISAV